MLDKIIIHSNRKQASLIFLDKHPVTLSSDVDVVPLLMWFLGNLNAYVTINSSINIEVRRDCSDEITMKIALSDAA